MARTKKVKSSGRLGAGFGTVVRTKLVAVESLQRKKQICPFCKHTAKRLSSGIWKCKKCQKTFSGNAYYLPITKVKNQNTKDI
ncbi:MAG: 50S ribosomal protein L37ae [Candidatus Pacearchaeota archaeon]|jgi:large subunit ribosomal protein L37Ae